MYITGIGCPFRFLFGIPCPGCGMTRAILSGLRLDFNSAFYYHPLWFLMPIAALALLYLHLFDKRRVFNITALAVAFLLVAVYAVRMFIGSDVLHIDFYNGLIGKFFSLFF
jgi:hypothetical protein